MNAEMKAKLKVEGHKTVNKAIEIGQIYEDMLNNNTNLINRTEYMTPPGYSILESPATPKILRFTHHDTDIFLIPMNPKNPARKMVTIKLSAVDVSSKDDHQRKLKLNNVSFRYIPDTEAAISVNSENVANAI